MRLNARQVFYEGGADATIMIGIEHHMLERQKRRPFWTEGHVARRVSAPYFQQPANYCRHYFDESKHGEF
jgi:hypothetical protein